MIASEPKAFSSVKIMGVVNTTPDSFSDGGEYAESHDALEQAKRLIDEGADIIDVGGESSRPGAQSVDEATEWGRVEPVLRALLAMPRRPEVSLDTRKPTLMLRAAALGVEYINDIEGFRCGEELSTALRKANPSLSYIAMHMHGMPETMADAPLRGAAAVREVERFLDDTRARMVAAGWPDAAIWLDPGFGFGKDDGATALMFDKVAPWSRRYNLCVGVSRKSFFGRQLGLSRPKERDPASKMTEFFLTLQGARMVRTHAVGPLRRLLQLGVEATSE